MLIESTTEVTGTIPAGTPCQFDEAATTHIMGILSNMYSNAKRAVLREYACNARDSHVEAGLAHLPVEVTLPTILNPVLIITDHGVGLDKDDIIRVYSRYGTSTKRDTNSQIGAFGIGGKSGFTVGSQFIVVGTKNGIRTSALFAIGADDTPTYLILDEVETDEPNGVSVQIATDTKHDEWAEEAKQLFSTWETGTVLVDGAAPTSVLDTARQLTDQMWLAEYNNPNEVPLVIMGGIAYPLGANLAAKVAAEMPKHMRGIASVKSALVHVPLGAVDISPNREELRDTRRTIGTVAGILLDAAHSVLDATAAEYAAIDDSTERALYLVRSTSELARLNLHSEHDIPTEFPPFRDLLRTFPEPEGTRSTSETIIDPENIRDRIWVVGDEETLAKARRRVNRWRNGNRSNSEEMPVVTLIDPDYDQSWFHLVEGLTVIEATQLIEEAKALPPLVPPASTADLGVVYRVADPNERRLTRLTVRQILDRVEGGTELFLGHKYSNANNDARLYGEDILLVWPTGSQSEKAMLTRLGMTSLPHIAERLATKLQTEIDAVDPDLLQRHANQVFRSAHVRGYQARYRLQQIVERDYRLSAAAREVINQMVCLSRDADAEAKDKELIQLGMLLTAARDNKLAVVLPEPDIAVDPARVSQIIRFLNTASPDTFSRTEYAAMLNALVRVKPKKLS